MVSPSLALPSFDDGVVSPDGFPAFLASCLPEMSNIDNVDDEYLVSHAGGLKQLRMYVVFGL
jgi:hypothetical protein